MPGPKALTSARDCITPHIHGQGPGPSVSPQYTGQARTPRVAVGFQKVLGQHALEEVRGDAGSQFLEQEDLSKAECSLQEQVFGHGAHGSQHSPFPISLQKHWTWAESHEGLAWTHFHICSYLREWERPWGNVHMCIRASMCSKYVYVHPHICTGNTCPGQWKNLKEGMQMVTASQGKRKDTSWKEEGQAGLRRGRRESVHRKERREGGQEHSHARVTVNIGAEGAGPQGGGRVAAAPALNQHERWKVRAEVTMFGGGLGPCGTAIPSDRAKQGRCRRLRPQAQHTGTCPEHSHFSFISSTSTLSVYQDSVSKKPHT